MSTVNAFISYSYADEELIRRLRVHLAMLQREGSLKAWTDHAILPGDSISTKIISNLQNSDVFIALLSPDYLASNYCYDKEFGYALSLADAGKLRIVPIILESCDWQSSPFKDFKAMPKDNRPISEWASQNNAFLDVVMGLRALTENLLKSAKDPLTALAQLVADVTPGRSSIGRKIEIPQNLTGFLGLFSRSDIFAPAVRLVGASDEFFPPECIHTEIELSPYILPADILKSKQDILNLLKAQYAERGALFHDGPHTRLVDYTINVDPISEQKHLTLRLGPIGWFDYSVAKFQVEDKHPEELKGYVPWQQIINIGSVKENSLPNILDTATTLISSDGYLLLTKRGDSVSALSGSYTSAVAENIHEEKDQSLKPPIGSELPSPFRAAIRGIDEELSPNLARLVKNVPQRLYFLGLAFDIRSYHPTALFMAVLPLSWQEIETMSYDIRGSDFKEGRLYAYSILEDPTSLLSVLQHKNWTGGGKASVLRSLEFIEVYSDRRGLSKQEAIRILSF